MRRASHWLHWSARSSLNRIRRGWLLSSSTRVLTGRLTSGLTYQATYAVTREMSPPHIDGILATSRMIGLIEDTCLTAVATLLEEGQTTVGTQVNVTHVGTALAGEQVTISVRLVKVTQ